MDLENVVKIAEENDPNRVNAYLSTGRWNLIAAAAGQTGEGDAYMLYSLGWLGAASDSDTSEFPAMPESNGWAEPRERI